MKDGEAGGSGELPRFATILAGPDSIFGAGDNAAIAGDTDGLRIFAKTPTCDIGPGLAAVGAAANASRASEVDRIARNSDVPQLGNVTAGEDAPFFGAGR